MRIRIVWLILSLALVGCGGEDKPAPGTSPRGGPTAPSRKKIEVEKTPTGITDSLKNPKQAFEHIAALKKETLALLKEVTEKSDAQTVEPRLKEISEEISKTRAKLKDLGLYDPRETEKAEKAIKMTEAEITTELSRLTKIPEVPDLILQALETK